MPAAVCAAAFFLKSYMPQLNNINIGEMEKFNPDNYPYMVSELKEIVNTLRDVPIYFKMDIVISFLKDHSIKTEWIEANPALIKILTSGILVTGNLEKLFEGCRWNKTFRLDFERYLKSKLNWFSLG